MSGSPEPRVGPVDFTSRGGNDVIRARDLPAGFAATLAQAGYRTGFFSNTTMLKDPAYTRGFDVFETGRGGDVTYHGGVPSGADGDTDADDANGVSLGGGLGYRNFDLDFAWVPFGDLGDTFRYAVTVRF